MHTAVKRPCLDDREVLAFVEGVSPPAGRWSSPDLDAIRTHLDACARCSDLIAAIVETRSVGDG